jgi:hypothetical protein
MFRDGSGRLPARLPCQRPDTAIEADLTDDD